MALLYFKYRTDFGNTVIDSQVTPFTLGMNEAQIQLDYEIPVAQQYYLYRILAGDIVPNLEANITAWEYEIGIDDSNPVPTNTFTGYTATTYVELSNKVVWKGEWSGGTYQKNDMVLDGVWTMVANKETTDVAAPQRVGSVKELYSPNNPSISGTTAKQIVFGMQYSGDQPFWLEGYRTYVIAGNDYNIILIKDPNGANEATFLNLFRATVTGWRDFGLVPRPVASGTTFQILAIVKEPDPTPTTTDIDYNYQKPSNWSAPLSGQIVHAGKRLQVLSIHHIDQDSIDRTTFLNSLVVGDIISVGDTNWSIQNNVDIGTYNDISVAPALQASVSNIQTFSFETVTATPISIGIDPNFWSGSTLVKGVYIKNGNWDDAVIDDNQYGIDITVQNASLSPDWDFVTAQGNGGGSDSNTAWGGIDGDILNQIDLQNQFATKLNVSGFTGYTATTETRLTGIEDDVDYISGITDTKLNTSIFNVYTGTTAPILNSAVTGGTSLGGNSIFAQKTGRNLEFKGLVAGTNIMLTPSSTGITITSTTSATGGTPYNVFTGYTATTEIRLDGIEADIQYISGQTGGVTNAVFTGYTATTETRINKVEDYASYGIGTGFLSGGTITFTGGTTFTVHAGVGLFIDQYTDSTNPIIIPVSWSTTVLSIITGSTTYLTVSSGGTFIKRSTFPSPQQRREEIFLGVAIHPQGVIISVNQNAIPSNDILATTYDLIDAVGLIKVDDGNSISSNGSSLQLKKSAGDVFYLSTNIRNNKKNPNYRSFAAVNPLTFQYRDIESVDYGVISSVDPTKYEKVSGLTSTIVTITGSTAQATAQRVYMFQSGGVRIQYGQKVYSSLEQAFYGFLDEPFITETTLESDGLLIGVIVMRVETTNLGSGSDAVFVKTDRYGSIIGSANGQQFITNNYQVVKTLADFPEPTGGSIQLQDNFQYKINGLVNLGTNRLVLGANNTILGENTATDTIIGTSTGSLIYGRSKSVTINTVSFRNLHPAGQVFDVVGTDASNFVARRMILVSTIGGKIGGYGLAVFDNMLFDTMKNGLTISGQSTNQGFLTLRNIISRNSQTGSTALTITGGSFNAIDISLNYFSPAINRTALRINSGTTLTTSGSLIGNQFFGAGTYIAGTLTKAAPNWNFVGNTNVNDSATFGFIKFSGNTTVTVITAITQTIKAAGSNFSSSSERIIVGTNRLTNNSNKTQDFNILLTGDLTVGGGTETIQVSVYKNGTSRIGTSEIRTTTANQPVPYAYNDIVSLAQSDYVEVFVRNLTSTQDIIMRSMQFRIEKT